MDILGSFVNIIDTYLIAPLVQRIKYLRNSRDNVNGLQTSVRNLTSRKNDKQSTLRAADNAGQVETDAASNWFQAVNEIEREANNIHEEYYQGTCARSWCVNCWSRYKVSKRSVNLKKEADLRLTEQFPVARQPSPEPVIEMEEEPTQNQPSTQTNLQQLIDHIYDPHSRIIGVYGMGGVGKTTLIGKVNNHFKENPIFDTVIMVTVSATPNIKDIQIRISERLGLDLSNATEDGSREKLSEALRKKKFLLILDDVWQQLELMKVGIPHPIRSHKGSKIMLTTRSQDVCTDMHADFTMKVKPLSREEAWTLFVEDVGQHVIVNDSIKYFAEKIVERCEGLPLAIVTVAHAMANRHGVGERANAEREMKESVQDIRGMENKVLTLLKFSFDRLDNDLLKSLFLYCACFPEDHNITEDDIFIFCVGEGLVDKCGSLIAARNKGEALIGSLKVACMLEDGEDEDDEGGSVRMHDMMRELALWITSPMSDSSTKFLIRTDESIVEAAQATDWVGATRISLLNTRIELPELGERCQKLTTLLLHRHEGIQTIPVTNFFQHMDHLSVLDLFDTLNFESLPDSLSCLVNLRVLRLQRCRNLRALPPLGMLRQLQVLDLSYCVNLKHQIFIPEWMGGVSKLRYLDVSCSGVSFQAGMISCLHRLEELRMNYTMIEIIWRVSSEGNNEGIDVMELYHLTQLTSLHICFKDMVISDWFKPLAEKTVQLALDNCIVMKDIIEALDKSQNPLKRLEIFNESQGLPYWPTCVEHLRIESCDDMEVMLKGVVADRDYFTKLKTLLLEDLSKLERIWVGPVPQNCFSQLSKIHIEHCRRLKMVFTKGMSGVFNNLRSITAEDCHMMEVIIEAEEEGSNISGVISFPKLERLWLISLSTLTDVCSNGILHCPRLQELYVYDCPKLKKDPLHLRITDDQLHIIEEDLSE